MAESNTANNGYNGLTSKIVIPYFNPSETKISAKAWIGYVEMARDSAGTKPVKNAQGEEIQVSNWSDKQTVTNAMLLLQGTANKWVEHILESRGPELENWEKFKGSFKERFIRSLTLTEKMNLRDLKMTSTESCRDFFDRCNNNINLFFEDEWQTLVLGQANAGLPWDEPGAVVTDNHIKISKRFHEKAKNIELKLAYVTGLKESIKKQVLFQQAETLDDILKIAQRVESGLKEIKKSEINILDIDSDDDEAVDVGAVNFKRKKNVKGGNAKAGGQVGQLKCFYCLKAGHFKKNCVTMRNDRQKGIFKSNINANPSPKNKAKMNTIDTNEDDDDDETLSVHNAQADISKYLNLHGV
jgi:hypothetical protein